MIRETIHALLACVVTFIVCAVAYPAAVYAIGHTLFPAQARGSLIERDGKVIGSELIAQPFASDKYFSPRPSAAGANGYAADAASGSNLGTTNPALRDRIAIDAARQVASRTGDAALKASLDRFDALQAELKTRKGIKEPSKADTDAIARIEEVVATAQSGVLDRSSELGKTAGVPVPVDLVTTSGAGLDPHISPEAARYQAPRVAAARGLSPERVEAMIEAHTDRSGEFIGAPPRVNVLLLNLALDREGPGTKPAEGSAAMAPPAATSTDRPVNSALPAATSATPVDESAPSTGFGRPESFSLAALSRRLDKLQERFDAAPDAVLATEVKGLRTRVDKIAGDLRAAANPARGMDEMVKRVSALRRDLDAVRSEVNQAKADEAKAESDKKLQAIGAEVASLKGSIERLEHTGREAEATPPALDLVPAVKLFREKRYADSSASFRALIKSHPDDARAWYFAALDKGLATNQWKAEATELANKGVERERAGTPSSEVIDEAFVELTRETGRDWLAYYRKLALKVE